MRELLYTLPPRLLAKLEPLAEELSARRKSLAKSDAVVEPLLVSQVVDGARSPVLVCETSHVDPNKGLHIRGREIATLKKESPESIVWLLLTGEPGEPEEIAQLTRFLQIRQS